jgi:hypothetical protein
MEKMKPCRGLLVILRDAHTSEQSAAEESGLADISRDMCQRILNPRGLSEMASDDVASDVRGTIEMDWAGCRSLVRLSPFYTHTRTPQLRTIRANMVSQSTYSDDPAGRGPGYSQDPEGRYYHSLTGNVNDTRDPPPFACFTCGSLEHWRKACPRGTVVRNRVTLEDMLGNLNLNNAAVIGRGYTRESSNAQLNLRRLGQ